MNAQAKCLLGPCSYSEIGKLGVVAQLYPLLDGRGCVIPGGDFWNRDGCKREGLACKTYLGVELINLGVEYAVCPDYLVLIKLKSIRRRVADG